MLVLARNVASWCISYLRFLRNYSSKRRKKSAVFVLDLLGKRRQKGKREEACPMPKAFEVEIHFRLRAATHLWDWRGKRQRQGAADKQQHRVNQ